MTQLVGFDIETSGTLPEFALQPWRVKDDTAWLTSFAVCDLSEAQRAINSNDFDSNVYAEEMPWKASVRALAEQWVADGATVCAWNAAFEASWLFAYGCGDLVHKIKWLDGMLLWRHLEVEPEYDTVRAKKRSFGLKAAVAEFFPALAGYDEGVNFHDMSSEVCAKRLTYNRIDTATTVAITKMLYDRLATNPQRLKAALVETAAISLVAESAYNGLPIDQLWCKALASSLEVRAQELLVELAPHGVSEAVVRSPKQLGELLYDSWGLPVYKENVGKKTGNISRSTDKEALHELSFIDPRAKQLQQYREALGNKTKFADKPLESALYNNDGMAHPIAHVFSTYTSRMTFSSSQGTGKAARQIGWAIHQEKRGKEYRNILVAPEGYTLCEFDAAGQEFRWMAIASMDDTMLALCAPGEDPHGFMGSRIAGADYRELVARVADGDKDAKDQRQLGKVANLSLQYRTSANKLRSVARVQYGLPMELPEATRIRATYIRTYPGVSHYWDRQIRECFRAGYVETFAGRRVQLPQVNSKNEWSVGSTAINYRIQGSGGDQKYLALAVLKSYMTKHNIKFAFELHDGLYLYIPDEKVAQCVPEIKKLLLELPYQKAWGITPPITLPWDAKTGKSWGTLKDWKEG